MSWKELIGSVICYEKLLTSVICYLVSVNSQEDYYIKSFPRPSEKTSGIHVEPKFSGALVPYKSQGRDSGGFFVDKCEMLELS